MAATGKPRRPPASVVRLLAKGLGRFVFHPSVPLEKQRSRLAAVAKTGSLPSDITVAARRLGGIDTEVVTHTGSADDLVVLHLHGGAYCLGLPAQLRGWAAGIAAGAGVTVITPDYRLAPEAPHPAPLDDALAVWKELTADVDPVRVVISGDSAGGGLAAAMAMRLRDQGAALPAGLILISPWLDLTADRRRDPDVVRRDVMLDPDWLSWCADAYAAGTDLADPALSPLKGSAAGLPPVLVQAGADDVLCVDSVAFARQVRAAGGDVELSIGTDLWHDFPLNAGMLEAADRAVRQAVGFVARVTGPAVDMESTTDEVAVPPLVE